MKTTTYILTAFFTLIIFFILPFFSQDTIFINADISTLDADNKKFEAVYIKNGKIEKLGINDEILNYDNWKTKVINLNGKSVLPGFIEAHCHPIATALAGQVMNVSGFNFDSRIEIIHAIKSEISNSNDNDWLLIFGWDPVMVDDLTNPTLAELDSISPTRPMLILTQMMHHGFINSAGYNSANITKDYPILEGAGEFKTDEKGNLNGVVYEVSALQYILSQLPKPPVSAVQLLLNMQFIEYAKAGFTSIGVLGPINRVGNPLGLMNELSLQDNIPVRTFIYALENQIQDLNSINILENDKYKIKGVKLYLDGSPFTGGAAFKDPYQNSEITLNRIGLTHNHFGEVNYTLEEIYPLIEKYHNEGHQIAIHVQGEVAIDIALNAFEKAQQQNPRENHKHRLEHNALITEQQIQRAIDIGVTLSFFIDHIHYYGDKLHYIVGKENTERYMPLGTALKHGDFSSVHTDNPTTPINALRPVKTAIERLPLKSKKIIGESEKITKFEALRSLTYNSAWQFNEEKNIGSIEIGKYADFVILSNNPLDFKTENYKNIEVIETWLGGKKVNTSIYTWTNFKLLINSLIEMV